MPPSCSFPILPPHLSTDSHFFLCTIQAAEVLTVMASLSVSSSARYIGIFVVIVVVQENTWIYFTYLKFCVLTNISPASSFPLPTLPLQPQHSPSVLLSDSGILQFHTAVKSCSTGLPVPAPSSVAPVSSPVLKWRCLLYGPWLHCVPTPHVHPVVELTLVLCLAFVNRTAVSTQSSCLFDRDFLYTRPAVD